MVAHSGFIVEDTHGFTLMKSMTSRLTYINVRRILTANALILSLRITKISDGTRSESTPIFPGGRPVPSIVIKMKHWCGCITLKDEKEVINFDSMCKRHKSNGKHAWIAMQHK